VPSEWANRHVPFNGRGKGEIPVSHRRASKRVPANQLLRPSVHQLAGRPPPTARRVYPPFKALLTPSRYLEGVPFDPS